MSIYNLSLIKLIAKVAICFCGDHFSGCIGFVTHTVISTETYIKVTHIHVCCCLLIIKLCVSGHLFLKHELL